MRPCQPSPASAPAAENAFVQSRTRHIVVGDEIFQPFLKPAHTAAGARFRPANPAAQIGHLGAGKNRRKSRIRRIEQMMAFVEHITHAPFRRRVVGFVQRKPVACGLRDHQRMIGNHDGRMPRAPDRALDETGAVMRARRIDAFAAPVGDFARAEKLAARNAGKFCARQYRRPPSRRSSAPPAPAPPRAVPAQVRCVSLLPRN